MVTTKQWEADPHGKLNIPRELQDKMKYKVIYFLGNNLHVAYCEDILYTQKHSMRMINVLMDTSNQYQGIMLKQRMTNRGSVTLFKIPAMIMELDDKTDHEEDAAKDLPITERVDK